MLLSGRLVQLIENHTEGVSDAFSKKIRSNARLPTIARLPATELAAWGRDALGSLKTSLLDGSHDLERRYRMYGCARFEESIPLHEAVLRLFLLKESVIEFVHEQAVPMTAVDLYAEEELDQRVGHFFDAAIYHLVCGYENAMRSSGPTRA